MVDEAARLGIDACGVCRAEPYVRAEALIRERRAAGLFADMRFTMAQPEISCHPETLLRGARSVVAAALYLTAVGIALLAVATTVFRRRDVA